MKKYKKSELENIQKEIKALAKEGKAFRPRIHAAQDQERYNLWDEKRAVGQEARYLLLAYAFLRGIPYRILEKKCYEDDCKYLRYHLIQGFKDALTNHEYEISEAELENWLSPPQLAEFQPSVVEATV